VRARVGRNRLLAAALLGALLASASSSPADAGVFSGTRGKWALGAGWNFGRGTFEDPSGERLRYREGSASQIRFGRALGDHFQVGMDYQGWAIEWGELVNDFPYKIRRSLQNVSATVTVIPGKPGTAFGGWYLRGGAGLGWAGTGAKEVHLGEETHGGEREDEWGVGFLAETGYEIWVVRHFSTAPSVAFNYFEIGGDTFVERAGFAVAQVTFTAYFGGDQ
jgi:hypothetical protein